MVTKTSPVTAEDLLNKPDDGFRYELVRGELRKMAPAGYGHGVFAMSIGISLGAYVKANNLGEVCAAETGFRLGSDPDHIRAPDTAFVRRERVEQIVDRSVFFPGAPDIAVEVISPSDRYTDVDEKVADWIDAGARAVVLVDPRRRIVKVHRSMTDIEVMTEEDVLGVDDIVPGWQMPVGEIFA